MDEIDESDVKRDKLNLAHHPGKDTQAIGRGLPLDPLTGEAAKTKSGSITYRGDACVLHHRFAVVEFDISRPGFA